MWNEIRTQLVQVPAPAERALLTRVYHRTWTATRWMFEKMGTARLKACVSARGGRTRPRRASFFNVLAASAPKHHVNFAISEVCTFPCARNRCLMCLARVDDARTKTPSVDTDNEKESLRQLVGGQGGSKRTVLVAHTWEKHRSCRRVRRSFWRR